MSVFLVAMLGPTVAPGKTIYVNSDATGANNGSNWANAFNYLQDALADANTSIKPVEIWVAEGTYKPDQGGGQALGDRYATFQLINSVSIYGGFPAPQILGSSRSYAVALGDLDGDGDLDAFVANYAQPNKVWLNGSAGILGGSGESRGSSNSSDVVAGDVDGDVDSYIANSSEAKQVLQTGPTVISVDPTANTHTALPGTDVSVTYDQDINPASVSDQTFVVHAVQTGKLLCPPHTTSVRGGTVTMNPAVDFKAGELVQATATTGIRSLAGQGATAAFVWRFRTSVTDGSGRFRDSGQNLGGSPSYAVALGDLDGDGDLDAFVANYSQSNKVWLNDGQGLFNDSGQNLGGSPSYAVALGDVDGDGDLDAFIANYFGQPNRIWLNDGQGVFSDSGQNLGSWRSYDVALGDLDGDGDLDAFVGNDGQPNKVWLNDGQGTFSNSGQSLGSLASRVVALGDLDGDGDLDAFVANHGQPNRIWLNDGQGAFSDSGQSLGGWYSWGVALGDVDGDGDLDAFVANYSQPNRIWLNDGQGAFTDSGQSLGGWYSWGVALGDLDGDGDLDAFVANHGQPNRVWLNDGQGVFRDSAEPGFEQRNCEVYETILSGDIGTVDSNADNSYHVVSSSIGTEPNAILDGFTITGGNANGPSAGHYNLGGGMFNDDGKATVRDCVFRANLAAVHGGGMLNSGRPTLLNCMFIENVAGSSGGGIFNNPGGSLTLINCKFISNKANGDGGGMASIWNTMPNLTNCIFNNNSAAGQGGGMLNFNGSHPMVTNCTFTENSAGLGGAICNRDGPYQSKATVRNCILWNDSPSEIYSDNIYFDVNFSDVEGGWPGGNIDTDPLFRDADGPDDIVGTEDDDLRLFAGSPCIDAGDNNSVPADTADLDGDNNTTEPIPLDLDGGLRFFDDPVTADTGNGKLPIVDIGAYEFGDVCGDARHPYPAMDFNHDCIVDFVDVAFFTGHWLECTKPKCD